MLALHLLFCHRSQINQSGISKTYYHEIIKFCRISICSLLTCSVYMLIAHMLSVYAHCSYAPCATSYKNGAAVSLTL